MKTFVAKPAEVERKWYVVDAEGAVLGRLATRIASILRGKHKPIYSPHMDVGDHVIIVNAEKIRVTGKKSRTKQYFRHSGHIGGVRMDTFSDLLLKHPERILEKAIRGMLPHNRLGRKMYKKLKVYAGPDHAHQAQKPEKLEIN
ncbi:50S ribosomal protein L13 [bacterium]|nr:50S ribosomal protein L13 [bacterium]